MSFKPAFAFADQDEPVTNGQAFATYEEAKVSAENRFMRWTMPTSFLVLESGEPVTWVIEDGVEKPVNLQ